MEKNVRKPQGGGFFDSHCTVVVMGSIPGPDVIRHLDQLSLPSFRGRQIE